MKSTLVLKTLDSDSRIDKDSDNVYKTINEFTNEIIFCLKDTKLYFLIFLNKPSPYSKLSIVLYTTHKVSMSTRQ